jgi:hypothetical protein
MSDVKQQFQKNGIPPVERQVSDLPNRNSMFYFTQRRSAGLQLLPWPQRDEEEFQRGKAVLGTLQIDPLSFDPDTLVRDITSEICVPVSPLFTSFLPSARSLLPQDQEDALV